MATPLSAREFATPPISDTGRRRLFLRPVPGDFDAARDLVIGPWCFSGSEETLAEWEAGNAGDGLTAAEERKHAAAAVRRLANGLLGDIAADLTTRHEVDYGLDYWRLIALPWLLHACQALWKRYRLIKAVVDRHADEPIDIEICPEDVDWTPADLFDFNARILPSAGFNFWLDSRIVDALAPAGWRLNEVAALPPDPERPSAPIETGAKAWARRRFVSLRCRQVAGIRWMAFPLSIFLNLVPSGNRRPPPAPPTEAMAKAEFPTPFLDLVDAILPRIQPIVLGDRFATMDRQAARRRTRPGRLNVVGPLLIFNEDDKFALAHAVEAGERIVCTQHGGGPCLKVNVNAVEVEQTQDAYLTWGWEGREDYPGRMVAVPSPLYSPYADRHRERNPALIMVAGEERLHAHRLETGHQSGQAVTSRRHRRTFLTALTPGIRDHLRYRPYPGGHGVLPDEPYMRRQVPDLQILDGPVEPQLMHCRLVVIDHPTTTFALAMAANVPTIAFLRPDVWHYARQAEPHFERFRELGIVFDGPEDAAAKVADVWDDVEAWWAQPDIQAARRAFTNEYARTSPVWWWHWMKTLWRL
jgi:hypothetical protein